MKTDIRHPIPPPAARWSKTRAARLGLLIGQGWSAERVAADPGIAATIRTVRRRAHRLGLVFREPDRMCLPAPVLDRIDAAAAKRRLSRDGLIRDVLIAAASDDGLIDNILDDGV